MLNGEQNCGVVWHVTTCINCLTTVILTTIMYQSSKYTKPRGQELDIDKYLVLCTRQNYIIPCIYFLYYAVSRIINL